MIVLCTDSLRGYGLNRIFELGKKAGYEGIDLAVHLNNFDSYNEAYIQSLIQQYQIPLHSITTPKEISVKRIEKIITMAKNLEAKVVVLQPPKLFDRKTAKWLKKEVPKIRQKEQISIALENAPSGNFLGVIPEHGMSNINDLKKFQHIALDTSRIGEKHQDIIRVYESTKSFLVHVHLSNFSKGQKYALPQTGVVPLESFLTKLKQEEYPGALSIKVLPKHLHAGNEEKVIEELKEIKNFCNKYYTIGDDQA